MATANYSSWSGGNPPQQGPSTTATVVDTDPPESFSRWPNRQQLQPDSSSWPNKKPPQRRQRRPVSPTDGLALSAQKPPPVGAGLSCSPCARSPPACPQRRRSASMAIEASKRPSSGLRVGGPAPYGHICPSLSKNRGRPCIRPSPHDRL